MKITNYPGHFSSKRLHYRPLVLEDALRWSAFFEFAEATAYFPMHMRGSGYLRALHWIEKQIMRYRDGSGGLMALVNEAGEFVGQCGLLVQHLDGRDHIEIGYHVLPDYWGQGYATEAANFFRIFAQKQHPQEHIISIIHPENQASRKVALRNSMQLWKRTVWHNLEAEIYATQRG
jgi:ribosomal-protein-alanine N-acetyltransferase